MIEYLKKLADLLNMEIVHGPFVGEWAHQAKPEIFGAWEAYAIWATSGVHMYAWEKTGKLITVDIYTCKDFENEVAVNFTKEFLGLTEVAWQQVTP